MTLKPKRIEDLLFEDEMHLYHRHIDDGMDLGALTEEFDMTFAELHKWWGRVENKLKRSFEQ